MIGANKHIFVNHFLRLMRLIYAAFGLLLALMTSAQCQQTADDWNTTGEALYNLGEYDEALRAYDEAIKLDPRYAAAWNGKGIVLFYQGKYDEAIQSFDKAIEQITKVQKLPISTAIIGLNNAASENNTVKILGIDSTAFPKVRASIFVDRFCAMTGDLKKENFRVKEDETEAAIDNLYFTGNASGQRLDLAIVFDETTSMEEEIDALKAKVKDLTQQINSSKLDARYSLVTFNGADVTTKINWSSDADSFRNMIIDLSASSGSSELPENSLDGIERALSFGFRADAQKVIIVITDGLSQQKGDGKSNSSYTMDGIKSDLLNSSAMLIAVSPDFRNPNFDPNVLRSDLPKYADLRELANEASGLWIEIRTSEFSTIMEQIQGISTGIYMIEYISPNQIPFENRTLSVFVDAPGCIIDNASNSYNSSRSAPAYNDSDSKAWINKGVALFAQGKYNEAIQVLDEFTKFAPNNAAAWSNKGAILNAQGMYDEAIQACDEAIRLDLNDSAAWNNRGWALSNQGKYEEAIQALDEAIRLDPNDATHRYNKGLALEALGRTTEAFAAFIKAKELGYIG